MRSTPSVLISLALLALTTASVAATASEPTALELERSARICEHMQVLASDEFEGREPGTPGEDKTLAYLQQQFEALGLEPAAEDGSYFQRVELARFTTTAPETIAIEGGEAALDWTDGADFLLESYAMRERVEVERAEFVYAGFGICSPELGWDDYADVDVRGKLVVVLSGSPDEHEAGRARWQGDPAANLYGQSETKRKEAARRGAVGLLQVYTQSPSRPWGWEALVPILGRERTGLRAGADEAQLAVQGMITEAARDALLGAAGRAELADVSAALEPSFRAVPLGLTTSFALSLEREDFDSFNAVAQLRGSVRPDEAMLYLAHWDHVGIGEPIGGDAIRNGAVDNASGTAAVLEIARTYTELDQPPRRSVLFMATTAEELGLLGSAWYAKHPLFPLAKTAAAFNLDAHFPYGRTTHVTAVVYGRSELDGYLDEAARRQGRILFPNTEQNIAANIFFRSDHFPLAEAGIPSEFAVGAGGAMGHDNAVWEARMGAYASKYHQPSDEYEDDFDCGGIWQDAELVFTAGRLLDRADAFPMWNADQPFDRVRRETRYATDYFVDVSRTHLPLTSLGGRNMDARPADLDGDGDLDLAVAGEYSFNLLLINDGRGHFTDETRERLPLAAHDSEDIAIADFDGDGDQDLVFVSEDDRVNEYYLNDGTGHFRDASFRLPVEGTSNAVLAEDLNGDGAPDLVIGNAPDRAGIGGQNAVLINDGQGNWTEETGERLPPSTRATQDLEFGDLDGDGDRDLVVGNEDDNEVLINNGSGVFFDETAARLPLAPGQWETREADLGDVDGDGDLDLFLANVNFRQTKDSQNRLFLNDGTGVFTDVTASALPKERRHTVDGDFVDLDLDGDLDLLTGSGFGDSYQAYRNEGGVFVEATAEFLPSSVRGDGIDMESADFDGDGRADLYFTNFRGTDFLMLARPARKR